MNRVVFVRVFLICVVLCAGLGMAQENPAAPPSNESVVARSTAGEITESELSKALGASTLKIRQQLYDVRLERLTNMMFEKVVSHAADKAGLPIDEYIDKEITSQFKDPDPAEVEAMLNQYRSRLPADESEARGRIEDFLREQDEDAIRKDIRARLFREAGVEFLLDAPRASVPIRDFNPVLGAADAPITLIEFSDFECPFCSRVKPTLAKLLDIYGEHVKYSFKHLPLPMHAQAR
ncbi:MAG: thioredoxin domain-containing protein, partial [bacterium]|nr:thioredoxin domain-containing protein [bacterium]